MKVGEMYQLTGEQVLAAVDDGQERSVLLVDASSVDGEGRWVEVTDAEQYEGELIGLHDSRGAVMLIANDGSYFTVAAMLVTEVD